jgi:hypothetical protein
VEAELNATNLQRKGVQLEQAELQKTVADLKVALHCCAPCAAVPCETVGRCCGCREPLQPLSCAHSDCEDERPFP